jgi:hypothetical protein
MFYYKNIFSDNNQKVINSLLFIIVYNKIVFSQVFYYTIFYIFELYSLLYLSSAKSYESGQPNLKSGYSLSISGALQ